MKSFALFLLALCTAQPLLSLYKGLFQDCSFCDNPQLKRQMLLALQEDSLQTEHSLVSFLEAFRFEWLTEEPEPESNLSASKKLAILKAFLSNAESPLCAKLKESLSTATAPFTLKGLLDYIAFLFVHDSDLAKFQMPKIKDYDCGMVPNGKFNCISQSEFLRGVDSIVSLFCHYIEHATLSNSLSFEHVLASIGSYTWSENFLLKGDCVASRELYHYYDQLFEFSELYTLEEDSQVYNNAFFQIIFKDEQLSNEFFNCLENTPNALELIQNSPNDLSEAAFKECFFIYICGFSQKNAWSKNERLCLILSLANHDLPTETLKAFIMTLVEGQGEKTHFERMLQLFRHLIHPLCLESLTDSRYFGYSAYLNSCDRMIEEFFALFEGSDLREVAKRVVRQLRRVLKAEEVWEFVHGRDSIQALVGEVCGIHKVAVEEDYDNESE